MDPDKRFSWSLAQSGRVSVTHQRHPGVVKNQVHIQCDCQPDSLLWDIVCSDRQGDVRPAAPTLLKKRVVKDAAPASDAAPSAAKAATGGSEAKEPSERTLVARVKSAKHENNELLLTDGELVLQGEDVIVRDGVPYFQAKSQLEAQPSVGPPTLTGKSLDRKGLESLAARDSQRNLYYGNSELLDGHKPIMQDPQIRFAADVVPMKSAARGRPQVESIDLDQAKQLLPSYDKLAAIEAERSSAANQTGLEVKGEGGELNQVVLVNGRCVLKDNCIAILRGLLHVGRTWHRIINGQIVGSNADHVTITGKPVYKDASDCSHMLLNGATLYSLGSTVYAGNAPLLEDAVLHADGQVINISELPLGSLCGIPAPERPEPPRLFVQGGRFSVQNTGLSIRDGTVWLQDVRMQLPEDTNEEVRVSDSLVFISPATVGQEANRMGEARDIIYANGTLLLDDLTPLLKGGSVCLGDQKQPLAWLSGDPAARSPQLPAPKKEELKDRVQMLTDATCILDQNGLYFIQGSMILQGKKVLIDRGVPLFSAETAEEIRKMNLGSPPPCLTGRVLLDAQTAKDLGAKAIADFFVLKDVRLDMTDGRIILNEQAPILSDCQLVMDRHLLSPMQLGFEAGGKEAAAAEAARMREKNAAKSRGRAPAGRDRAPARKKGAPTEADGPKANAGADKSDEDENAKSAAPKGRGLPQADAVDKAGLSDDASTTPTQQPVAAALAPQKTGVSIAATSTADMEDSGRGTSDWAESSQRAATALGSVAETPGGKKSKPATDSESEADAGNAGSRVAGAAASDRRGGRGGAPSGSEEAPSEPSASGGKAAQRGLEKRSRQTESDDSGRPRTEPTDGEKGKISSRYSDFNSDGTLIDLSQPGRVSARQSCVGQNPDADVQLEESGEKPNRLSSKSLASGKNIGVEMGRDSVADSYRGSMADFDGDPDLGARAPAAQQRTADSGADGGRHEREVPASANIVPLGDTSSNAITGNFSVTSSSADKKLVFSLKARIDEMLSFLDQQR
ncbi:hypothetical protein BOX15_Mlig004821g1 [Macrostomum lignano]|uniref:Uncharacterized protein n=1 Tax=Macrostomum lignano TaxID=282301 RepID=A0A267F514_9PLAT|nr:hypothetical protein BOX15_Mlig004821g1 [Macrostomum lignano]